jgi:hypothetical protein
VRYCFRAYLRYDIRGGVIHGIEQGASATDPMGASQACSAFQENEKSLIEERKK